MVASQETLDSLEDIGLNMYERKIFAALLSRGISTAGELSEMTGVPRSRAYDVLESLAAKGFVILKPSKPMEYVAVPPEEALENAKKIHYEELKNKVARIDKFRNSSALEELRTLYNEGVSLVDPSDVSGALKGRYNIFQHVGNMIKGAEKEINFVTTEKGLNELFENYNELLMDASERGAKIRVLAPLTDDNRTTAESLRSIGEVRALREVADEAPFRGRFSVIDGRKITFALTHDRVHPTQDTAFWTESPHAAAENLSPLFELLWQKSA